MLNKYLSNIKIIQRVLDIIHLLEYYNIHLFDMLSKVILYDYVLPQFFFCFLCFMEAKYYLLFKK